LVQKFKITQIPTLMALTDAVNYEGEVFDGELKID